MKGLMFIVLLFLLVLGSQCYFIKDINLIKSTCKRTPNYNLCVSSLQSDPRSTSADLPGLALIMVNIVSKKAKTTLQNIQQLLGTVRGARERQNLHACVNFFNMLLKTDVPEAIEAVTKGDPKFAEDGMKDAATEADSCREKSSRSSVADMSKNVHDLSVLAVAIIKLLE